MRELTRRARRSGSRHHPCFARTSTRRTAVSKRATVEFVIEPGDPFGEIAVDAAAAELVGQTPRAPPAIDRTKLDKTLREGLVIEELELVETLEGRIDLVVVKPLAPELFDQLGAEVIAPGDELESLVVGRIVHNS